jgi:hypothetical protein
MDKFRGFWEHVCKEAGHTATLKGEPCNWCDISEEDIETWVIINDIDADVITDPQLELCQK